MALRLDLSTGGDSFVEVIVSGWSQEQKRRFRYHAGGITGVTSVDSAGGRRAFHVHFSPEMTNAEAVRNELASVARLSSQLGVQIEGAPNDLLVSQTPTPSSDWTGIQTGAQRARAAQALLPAVADAVSALIVDLEGYQDNGGPPLQDRDEALETLRQLHDVLGEILVLADRGSLKTGQGLGLLGEVKDLAGRACRLFVDDPVRCSVVAIAATVAAWLGPSGAVLAGVGAVVGIVPSRGEQQ